MFLRLDEVPVHTSTLSSNDGPNILKDNSLSIRMARGEHRDKCFFVYMFLNVMFQAPMEIFKLESKFKLPLFSGFTIVHSNGYVGFCLVEFSYTYHEYVIFLIDLSFQA